MRIGLMGFGRIGRNLFRQLAERDDLGIVSIVDRADPDALTYLLKYDSIYGRFPHDVDYADGTLSFAGRSISFSTATEPHEVDWSDHGVDVVVQAIGRFRTREYVEQHLAAGAPRVVLASTPETPGELPILHPGFNDEVLDANTKVVAMGSNTSQAMVPVLKTLDDEFGIERAFFTTIHAFTNFQRLADVPTSDFRTSRAAGENIIPAPTSSPQIITQVLPQLEGKLSAMALNVPVPDGSTVDLSADLATDATKEAVNGALRAAALGPFAGRLEYTEDPIVSSDVRGSTASGIVDGLATMATGSDLVKIITWFDNGWGYTARMVEALERIAAQQEESA
ncbi:MAG: glyceraldehyde 3-phosphate dehydrogenase NAD-binding domain-containing protein [Acidimicrobiia bacterium]